MENKEKLNLFQKLLVIQNRINGLGKDKSAFNYKYVTGDKVLGEIKPMMNELGLILKQEILGIENVRQDYQLVDREGKIRQKNEILSKVDMRFTWVDADTGDKDENLFGANGQNDWDKGVGSALTYAERYFLLKYFHIATDEDDIDNPDRKDESKVAPGQVSEPSTDQKVANMTGRTNPELTEAINQAILACKSRAEVTKIWNDNPALQVVDKFAKAIKTKHETFPKPPTNEAK